MSALILDGKTLAAQTEAELSERVAALKAANNGQAPILGNHSRRRRPCISHLCKDEAKRL